MERKPCNWMKLQIGGWVWMTLSLPAVNPFSIQNHLATRSRTPRYHDPQHAPFPNTFPSHEKDEDGTNPGGIPTRMRSCAGRTTRLLEDTSDLGICDSIQSSLELQDGGRFKSSMENGWRVGLKQLYSSPATIGLVKNKNSDNRHHLLPIEDIEARTAGGVGLSLSIGKGTVPSPLVVQPNNAHPWPSSPYFLRAFVEANPVWVRELVLKYGAVVFRGFDEYASPSNSILRALESCSDRARSVGLEGYLVAPSPPGEKSEATSSNAIRILPEVVTTDAGITDLRKIYPDLPPELRTKLANRKLLYRRSENAPVQSPETKVPAFDIGERKTDDQNGGPGPWFQLFGTTNKKIFERTYRTIADAVLRNERRIHNSAVERNEYLADPFAFHPETRERVWFGLAHTFHWTSAPAKLFGVFCRTGSLEALGRALRTGARSLWVHGIRRERTTPVEVTFGDGTPISVGEMHQIRRVVRKNTAYSQLQEGDLLIIDAVSVGLQID